jgi:hypothetical protein
LKNTPQNASHHSPSPLTASLAISTKKYNFEAVIGDIADFVAPDWAEWLGISQYVSKWDSSYYLPAITAEYAVSEERTATQSNVATADISVLSINPNSMMYQDIDVDLSSLFSS